MCSIGLESLLWLRMVLYIMFVQYCYSPNSTSTQLNYVWFDTKLGLQTTHHHPTKLNLGLLIPSLFLPSSSSTSTSTEAEFSLISNWCILRKFNAIGRILIHFHVIWCNFEEILMFWYNFDEILRKGAPQVDFIILRWIDEIVMKFWWNFDKGGVEEYHLFVK